MTWLLQDERGRLAVRGDLSIAWCNPVADEILEQKIGLEIRSGQLCTTDPSQQESLIALIANCEFGSSSWALVRPDRDGHLLIHAQRLASLPMQVSGLCLFRTGSDFQPRYEQLDAAFGLTGAEHRILLALLGGKEADNLARFYSISVETARTHIRNIYAKLDVSSREQLFFKASAFRV